ncbi:7140_t:CDS:2, partial [Gigaspora rosea]
MAFFILAEKLSVCILEEDKKTEYALFRASILKTVLTATADTILPNVCKMLHKYFTAKLLKIQEDQIKQVLQYHGIKIEKNVLQRFVAIDLNLFGENPNFTAITAKSMLELVNKDKIVEMWGIRHITKTIFLVAQKFEIEQSIAIGWNGPVPYLNALVKEVRDVNHKIQAIQVVMKIDNGRLDPSELINSYKHKGKGRPKGTDRIRRAGEPSKKTKRKLHCKICR